MEKATSFEDELREALNHLYDPVALRQSPLTEWLGLRSGENAGALRQVLTQAIRDLRPTTPTPANCKSRRYYQILFYRYAQQFTQEAVAQKIGLSPRHLRREQDAAIHALAELLYDRFKLQERGFLPPAEPLEPISLPVMPLDIDDELAQLGDSLLDRTCQASSVLFEALQLVERLAERYQVALQLEVSKLPLVAMAATVFKQVILDLLNSAIRLVAGGQIRIAAPESSHSDDERRVMLCLSAFPVGNLDDLAHWEEAQRIAGRLLEMSGGRIEVEREGNVLVGRLWLPVAERIHVLAIEDNTDTLQLWRRYVEDSPFWLVGVQDPHEVLVRAEQIRPRIIVLDVMLPDIDGWELLGRLQYHPATQGVPIIVCTVHPQRELAFSLGASDFVRKPTTRQEFLAALKRQIEV